MISKTIKAKPCRAPGCPNKFIPSRPFQQGCCFECEVALGIIAAGKSKAKREKDDRKDTREKLAKLKTLVQWLKEAQAAFNAFIRERDRDEPCISCGRYHQGSYDAGHYRSVGAARQLRFNEDNCFKQCVPCNQFKSGNAIEYRIRLIERIGAARVEALECNNEVAKYTIEDAKRIKAAYVLKLKELIRGRESIALAA